MQYIPGKSAGELFTEAFNPYLQMMVQAMMKKKLDEQQQPYEIQKALISGGMAQPFTPQMTQSAEPTISAIPDSLPYLRKAQSQYTKPDFSAGGIPFQYVPSLEREKTQSQIDLNKIIAGRFGDTSKGDIIYRNAITGEEVDKNTALMDMAQGNTNKYIVSKVTPTKYGETETPVIKPEDLTQEEKNYVITSKRIQGRLKSIQDIALPKIKSGEWKDWQSYQAQGIHPLFVRDKELQRFQSDLQSLKADIPFLRGGKQLTPMEAKRVDMLLDPLGKDEERYANDIQTFMNEFVSGEQLMLKGVKALNQKGSSQDTEYQKYLKSIGQ